MFGFFETKPKNFENFSNAEVATFKGKVPASATYADWTAAQIQLYRALVREFALSKKIQAFRAGTRRADVVLEKVTHMIARYHIVHVTDQHQFKAALQAAYDRAHGDGTYPGAVLNPLFNDAHETQHGKSRELTHEQWRTKIDHTGEYAGTALYYGGLATKEALVAFEQLSKLGGTATGGALSVLAGARAVRVMFRAADRSVVAEIYASRYPENADGDFESHSTQDMDAVLGFVAAYAINQARRLGRRKATEAMGAGMSAVGGALTLTGPGAIVGVPMAAVGLAMGLEITAEELIRSVWKRAWGTRGVARHEAATLLWLSGAQNHRPTIDFMVDMGMIPLVLRKKGEDDMADSTFVSVHPSAGTEPHDAGETYIALGYFTPLWFDAAVNRIMRKLRST